jgi:hypothetical protein
MRTCVVVLVSLAFVLIPVSVLGQVKPTLWLGGAFGFGTYAMSDINDDISNFNAVTGLNMDEINNGFSFGIQAGVNATPALSLSAGYERLFASSKVGDYSGEVEYNFPANAIYGEAQYTFPSPSPFHVGLSGAMGMVSAAGEVKVVVYGYGSATGDISGSGLFFAGKLVGDYYASPRLIISPSFGYRFAKISEFEVDGEPAYNSDGSRMSLDYSGFILRGGLKVLLN